MSTQSQGAPAPRITRPYAFQRCNSDGDLLFSVSQGIRVGDAIETAHAYVAAATAVAKAVAEESISDTEEGAWASVYLMEFAQAVLCACVDQVYQEAGHE